MKQHIRVWPLILPFVLLTFDMLNQIRSLWDSSLGMNMPQFSSVLFNTLEAISRIQPNYVLWAHEIREGSSRQGPWLKNDVSSLLAQMHDSLYIYIYVFFYDWKNGKQHIPIYKCIKKINNNIYIYINIVPAFIEFTKKEMRGWTKSHITCGAPRKIRLVCLPQCTKGHPNPAPNLVSGFDHTCTVSSHLLLAIFPIPSYSHKNSIYLCLNLGEPAPSCLAPFHQLFIEDLLELYRKIVAQRSGASAQATTRI